MRSRHLLCFARPPADPPVRRRRLARGSGKRVDRAARGASTPRHPLPPAVSARAANTFRERCPCPHPRCSLGRRPPRCAIGWPRSASRPRPSHRASLASAAAPSGDALATLTVDQIRAGFLAGSYTPLELTKAYLDRNREVRADLQRVRDDEPERAQRRGRPDAADHARAARRQAAVRRADRHQGVDGRRRPADDRGLELLRARRRTAHGSAGRSAWSRPARWR